MNYSFKFLCGRFCGWYLAVVFCLLMLPEAMAANSKPLMVYYMPWFVARPHSAEWGWHWTMDHFNPEIVTASGERQIASWYYPLIGPYDSADPVVLEYHVLLMKLAGIDGVIVDWYGADDYLDYRDNNERTASIFQYARKAGLKFCLCYEDRTIQQEISGGFIAASNAIQQAQQTLRHVETNYFNDPGYLHWNNQAVLLNFGPQYFKRTSQWEEIFSGLSKRPALFTEDNRLPAGVGAFDWPPMWLSQAPGTGGVLSSGALQGYLTGFQDTAGTWPAYISSAFPRFHDIYQKAGIRDYWGYLGDRGGDTLRETLRRALTNKSVIAQIVTWNDYGEGTVVEPTVETGYRDLGIIQELRREHLDASFSNGTNDLTLARRVYDLRRKHAANSEISARLDEVFLKIRDNDLAGARKMLSGLETDSKLVR